MKKNLWSGGSLLLLLVLMLGGCGDGSLLEEIPRDFALQFESTLKESQESEASEEADSPVESDGDQAEENEKGSFLCAEMDDYARASLSPAEQIWYDDIAGILGEHSESGELSLDGISMGLNEDNVDKVFQCVMNDHPELFYVEGYAYTKYTRGDSITSIQFAGTYNADRETALEKKSQIEAAVLEILGGISAETSDYDKAKYVYETIIRKTDYELGAPDNQNIYSVFVNHLSVCQGYAKAAQYLLNRLGVECTLVLGTVENGEGHAWNLLKVDGSYYYMDTTWGDASYRMEDSGESDSAFMPEINYDYFNVTTTELLKTHTPGGEIPLPACVSVEANYYFREGALFYTYDREQMKTLFERALEQGREDVTVKCADADCYDRILDALIQKQEIFDYMGSPGCTVAYTRNEKQLSLTFWVTNE